MDPNRRRFFVIQNTKQDAKFEKKVNAYLVKHGFTVVKK
jgi:hypothetical protein